jgi:hypothetical protein
MKVELMGVHAFDGRQPHLVAPSEIRAGDWLRDCGRLRHVESVDASSDVLTAGILVRFSDSADGPYTTLSVPLDVTVTVWREFTETEAGTHV